MPQLGLKRRQPRVEQLVATLHICLQQIAGRLPMLDRVQRRTLNALLLVLRKHQSAAQPLAQSSHSFNQAIGRGHTAAAGEGVGLVFRGPPLGLLSIAPEQYSLADRRLSWTAG